MSDWQVIVVAVLVLWGLWILFALVSDLLWYYNQHRTPRLPPSREVSQSHKERESS